MCYLAGAGGYELLCSAFHMLPHGSGVGAPRLDKGIVDLYGHVVRLKTHRAYITCIKLPMIKMHQYASEVACCGSYPLQ
jgi:hypothetical protein